MESDPPPNPGRFTFGLEAWLRWYVISRIPGATAGNAQDPDLIDSAADSPDREQAAALLAPRPAGRAAWLMSQGTITVATVS